MMSNDKLFSGLEPHEIETLSCLSEECAEVSQIVSKIVRHGFESWHPKSPGDTNRQLLEKESGDVLMVILNMVYKGMINPIRIEVHAHHKLENLSRYLHHNDISDDFREWMSNVLNEINSLAPHCKAEQIKRINPPTQDGE